MPRRRPVRVRPKAPAADESPTALEASPRSGADERRAEDVPTASEALRVLTGLAHRRTGRIPAPLLVRHALRVARGGGWPVEKAALEAILRRVELRQADALRVGARPSASPFGRYTVRRARGASRPYDVLLDGLDPIEASCDCDDFVRASLGLCKHVATVLDDLAKRPKRFEAWARSRRARDTRDRWTWNPIRPLAGPGDWLDGLRLRPGSGRASSVALPPALRGLLVETGAGTGVFAIASGHVARARRRALVEALEHAVLKAPRGAPVDVDPAVRALLVEERRRLDARHDAARDVAATRAALRTLKQRLYPYQRVGVERFLETGSLLLADDMGLGKTAQAIASCHVLYATKRATRGLLIVPAALKPQWAREWSRFTDTPLRLVEGDPAARAAMYRTMKRGFLVANYEQVLRDLELMRSFDPEVVVLDEAQRIKNFAAKTAVCVKRLEPRLRLVLTGTPMENRLGELSSLLDVVDDRALEPIWRLEPWHAVRGPDGRETQGVQHLGTLRERLAGCMLRRLREDVLAQLPARTDTRIPVDMTDEQRDEHDALTPPIAQLAAAARSRPLTPAQFLRLMSLLTTQRVIANGLAQLRFDARWPALEKITRPDEATLSSLSAPKLAELREILAQVVVGQARKTVVFSQWRRMLLLARWATRDVLDDAGVRCAFFTGAEGAKQRERNLVEFHDDPDVRVLFATDAGGVGLNLQRAASCCVNLELPWNPAVLEQRIGRIHRLGQTRPIDVYSLVSRASIEERIADVVGDKRALFTGLFDGTADEVAFSRAGSFVTRLDRIVSASTASAPARETDPAPEPGIAADRAIDEVVEAADESMDATPAAHTSAATPTAPTTVPASSAAGPRPADVRDLLSRVSLVRQSDGGIRIEAPPESASTLAALFEGLADLLRRGATGSAPPP